MTMTLELPEAVRTKQRLGEMLADAAMASGGVWVPNFIKVPPDDWTPAAPRDLTEDGFPGVRFYRPEDTTPQQRRRAFEYQIWWLTPELEHLMNILFLDVTLSREGAAA
jgi:hypothetical protein